MHMLHAYEFIKSVSETEKFYYLTFMDEIRVGVRKKQIYQLAEYTWVSADAIRILLAILKHSWLDNSLNTGHRLPKLQEYEVNGSLALLLDKFSEEELIENLFYMKYADIVSIFKDKFPCEKYTEMI